MRLKKYLISIISIAIMLGFVSCSENLTPEKMFSLTIDNPQKVVKQGSNASYTAFLSNLTDNDYTLKHGAPIILLYIRKVGDNTPESAYPAEDSSIIKAGNVFARTIGIEDLEPGEYVVRANCSFLIDDKQYDYKSEDVSITIEP